MASTCPICGRSTPQVATFLPFCSVRCQRIDLARWLDEDYRLPVPEPPPEQSDPQ